MSKQPKPPSPALMKAIQEIHSLYERNQLEESWKRVERALAKNPRSGSLHALAAMILIKGPNQERARYHADKSVALDPINPDVLSTRASFHMVDDEHDKARALYERALKSSPDHPGALAGLGTALSQLGNYSEARHAMSRLHKLNQKLAEPLVNLALLELETTHASRAIELLKAAPSPLDQHPNVRNLHALAHSYDDDVTPEQAFDAHKRFGDEIAKHIPPQTNHPNDPDPDRPLRIGYISPDLRQHSIAYFLEPILANHDKANYQAHCFMTSSSEDAFTDRFKHHAHTWHNLFGLQIPDMAQAVRDANIDILIDLNGHFSGHKLPVFAMRPAPVQITFIGYANTTGMRTIDARIVDNTTDPAPSANAFATEQLVRIDPCFLCYRPHENTPEPREPDPALPVTIGSFNNLMKLSTPTIRVWSEILKARPAVRLLLKASKLASEELKAELLQRFADQGIDQSRLDLRAFSPTTQDHLNTYNEIDLALDTFPYTGTTTTCESLVMGVPVLSLLGNSHAGRVSASLLSAIDRKDLIARSEAEYISKALEIIDSGKRNKSQRESLRQQVLSSPLCDQATYTRKVEDAYRTLWTQWCNPT
tara:strand:- start:168153 stop:169937 length:1785 start_codon:yes stop_codon:yes gene_type:complete